MIHDDYSDARQHFRQAAIERSAALSDYVCPVGTGRQGEILASDVAVLGDPRAPKALLVVSGEHGLEGAPGSGGQIALLTHEPVPQHDIKIVLVHAANPWGFSHNSRANEENVDVNRNFVDFDVPYKRNVAYDAAFPILCPPDWTDDMLERTAEATKNIQEQHGAEFLLDGMTAGQRHEPTGTNYGGLAPSWTRTTLEAIVAEHLSSCEKVGFVDWHTGFGDYADIFLLCTHPPGSNALEQVSRWWGNEAVTRNASAFPGAGGAVPKWQGMFAMALPNLIPHADVAGSVVEFGTYPNIEVRTSIMIDRFRRFGRANRSSMSDEQLRVRMLEGFTPRDPVWRATILERSLEVHRAALRGLAAW